MQEKVHDGSASSEKRCTIGNLHLEAFGAPLRTTWGVLGTFWGFFEDILRLLGGSEAHCKPCVHNTDQKRASTRSILGSRTPRKDRQDVPKRCLEGIGSTRRKPQHDKTDGISEKLKNDDPLDENARF